MSSELGAALQFPELADAGIRAQVIVCPRCPELAPIIVNGGRVACEPAIRGPEVFLIGGLCFLLGALLFFWRSRR